jgi:hypothetical protein
VADLGLLALHVILDLAARRQEGVANRDVGILVADVIHDQVRARDRDVHGHRELLALLAVVVRLVDHDPASGHVRMELLELGGLLPDQGLERGGYGHVAKADLKRNFHRLASSLVKSGVRSQGLRPACHP